MTMIGRTIIPSLLLALSTGCYPARSGGEAVREVAGSPASREVARADSLPLAPACYELMPGPWQTDSLLRSIADPHGAPRRFKLDTVRLAGWEPMQERSSLPMYAVHAYPDSGQNAHLFTYWWGPRGTRSETIRIGYPLSLGGVSLQVGPAAGGLTGHIVAVTDFIQPGQASTASSPITARRITCPSDR